MQIAKMNGQMGVTNSRQKVNNQQNQTCRIQSQPNKDVVAFGANVKINSLDGEKFFSSLFGVKVEKIANDANSINFETVESFPFKKAIELCDKAEDKLNIIKNDVFKAKSIPEFAAKLYRYLQMGGGEDARFRCYPAGRLVSPEQLMGASTNKVILPIIISHAKGSSSYPGVSAFRLMDVNPKLSKELYDSLEKSSSNKIITEFDGEKYGITKFGGYSGSEYSAEKI